MNTDEIPQISSKANTLRLRAAFVLIAIVIATIAVATRGRSTSSQDIGHLFVQPDRNARESAIGSTKDLSPILRRAFTQSNAFDPVPDPGPFDWLAQHSEVGQTFEQYIRSQPNQPDSRRNTIYFLPLGEFSDSDAPNLDMLRDFAAAFFALPVKIKEPIALKGLAITSRNRENERKQILSTDVLDWLKTRSPDDGYCLLAITMEDLYPDPKWNFVFGQASLRDRVGVYSFARYHPSFYGNAAKTDPRKVVLLRSCKVLAHETGHMFGVKHCIHFRCLMNGSNHLAESDAQPIHLCPVCLRKMQAASKFDVVKRYEDLQRFSDRVGWADENDWLSKRLEALKL